MKRIAPAIATGAIVLAAFGMGILFARMTETDSAPPAVGLDKVLEMSAGANVVQAEEATTLMEPTETPTPEPTVTQTVGQALPKVTPTPLSCFSLPSTIVAHCLHEQSPDLYAEPTPTRPAYPIATTPVEERERFVPWTPTPQREVIVVTATPTRTPQPSIYERHDKDCGDPGVPSNIWVGTNDIYGLDADGDRIGCEE